jgi:hypothetical protein
MSQLRITVTRRQHGITCEHGPHYLPVWYPRLTLHWASDCDATRACIRHTRRAFRALSYSDAQRRAYAAAASTYDVS